MKVYYPSSEEFTNPITYIEKLFAEGAAKYGVVKIVPPKEFKPTLAYDCFSELILPSRF